MIEELRNPLSGDYCHLKNFILSHDFPWFRFSNTTRDVGDDNIGMFSHTFLERPEVNNGYSKSNSPYIDSCIDVLREIIIFNKIDFNLFYRVSANLVAAGPSVEKTVEHNDHKFPHTNIIIYLSDSDGDTVVGKEIYTPKEDRVIIFRGAHYHCTPTEKDRIVLVGTFL